MLEVDQTETGFVGAHSQQRFPRWAGGDQT